MPFESGASFSLQNFVDIYADPSIYSGVLPNTLIFAAGSVSFAFILALAWSWVLERTDIPFRNLFYVLLLVPFLIPSVVMAIAWVYLLAVMREGRLIQSGNRKELYTSPEDRFVAEFPGGTNIFEGTVTRADSMSQVEEVELAFGRLTCLLPVDSRSGMKVAAVVRPEAIGLLSRPSGCDDTCFQGKIEAETFLGNSIEYQVRVGGQKVCVRAPTYQGSVFEGDVFVHLPKEAVKLFLL